MSRTIDKILIVDDEADICYLVKSILKRQTHAKIDIATSVKEGRNRLNEDEYDLAFFDMQLADGTGTELVEYIHEETNQTPYIAVISAHTSTVDVERIKKLEVNEFIGKPLSQEKIINCYLAASV